MSMSSRLLSGALIAFTVANGAWHHLPGKALAGLAVALGGCALLIWYPRQINDLTLGAWTRGGQIDVPTPPGMIAGFGWIVLLAVAAVINWGLVTSS